MRGNITQRGNRSWRLKFDAGRDAAGQRKIQYETFRGTKREAQNRLAVLIASVGQGSLCRAEQGDGRRIRARPGRNMGGRR